MSERTDAPSAEDQYSIILSEQEKVGRLTEGQVFCVISRPWWVTWCAFVGCDPNDIKITKNCNAGGPRPSPIDSSALQVKGSIFADELRTDMTENVDFELLVAAAFGYLHQWYGGGPTFKRSVVSVGIMNRSEIVDMHPSYLNICTIGPDSDTPTSFLEYDFSQHQPMAVLLNSDKQKLEQSLTYLETHEREKAARKQVSEAKDEDENIPKAAAARVWVRSDEKSDRNGSDGEPVKNEGSDWALLSADDMKAKIEFMHFKNGTELMIEYRGENGWLRSSSKKDWTDFKVNDIVDVEDRFGSWYESRIRDVKPDRIQVRFIGWSASFDEYVPIDSKRIAPQSSHTSGPYKSRAKAFSYQYGSKHEVVSEKSGKPNGLVGLQNLGNTCFMNSMLQCMSNTPLLTEFFVEGNYVRDINRENNIGHQGRVATAYGDLLSDMWSGKFSVVNPGKFKDVIGEIQPRFKGYLQHDAQEILTFLMDGLHEDLNRVREKPCVPSIDSNNRPDAEVAAKSWSRHLLRNQSVIVDLCQGQLKSTVQCPEPKCNKISITFDPFFTLTTPIPEREETTLLIAVARYRHPLKYNAVEERDQPNLPPLYYTVVVKRDDKVSAVKKAIADAINKKGGYDKTKPVPDAASDPYYGYGYVRRESPEAEVAKLEEKFDEIMNRPVDVKNLVLSRMYDGKIVEIVADDSDIPTVKNRDQNIYFFAYEIINADEDEWELYSLHHELKSKSGFLAVGFGMLVSLPKDKSKITNELLKRQIRFSLLPYRTPYSEVSGYPSTSYLDETFGAYSVQLVDTKEFKPWADIPNGTGTEEGDKEADKALVDFSAMPTNGFAICLQWRHYNVDVRKTLRLSDADKLLMFNDEVEKAHEKKGASTTIARCFDEFVKEEKLLETEMWYCNNCKEHKMASKKLDLWHMPEIFIVHFKRFNFDRWSRDKNSTLIDFPLSSLDMSPWVVNEEEKKSAQYDLYAVSQHYGGLNGGHYTAVAKNIVDGNWYKRDDSSVSACANPQASMVDSSAYVLFYSKRESKKRIGGAGSIPRQVPDAQALKEAAEIIAAQKAKEAQRVKEREMKMQP